MCNPWDKLARPRHLELVEGKDITFSEVLLPVILQTLKEQEKSGDFSVLDIGCGTGFLTRVLAGLAHRVAGIDSSKASIRIAEEHTEGMQNVSVEHLSLEDYARRDRGQFDFVLAHMSLQAIEDLALAINSVSICLKEEGRFLFSIPHPCFWALVKEEISRDDYSYHVCSRHANSFKLEGDIVIEVPYFHRPLEVYSSELSRSGFLIEKMIEPFPDDELMQQYRRSWFFPGFIFFLCRKNNEVEVNNEQ